jgi:hypothetical protein
MAGRRTRTRFVDRLAVAVPPVPIDHDDVHLSVAVLGRLAAVKVIAPS